MSRLTYQGLGCAALALVIDQASKWWVMTLILRPPRLVNLTPFFDLVPAWNRGISFGLLDTENGVGAWLFSGLALIIVGVLLVWLRKADRLVIAVALGTIIGGALGNVIDRVRFGAVFDFLDFYLGPYHWPAFNAADAFISMGAIFLVVDSLFARSDLEPKIDRG